MYKIEWITHLSKRGLFNNNSYRISNPDIWYDFDKEIITFPLWSSTGQLLGYHQYNWKVDKLKNNDGRGRYHTYRIKDWLTFWGLDMISLSSKEPLYVVEGVWDAISVLNIGYRCISVLSNNPKQLKNLLNCLPCKTIAICDGDEAGKMLTRVCDDYIILPQNKDCNDFNPEELRLFLGG